MTKITLPEAAVNTGNYVLPPPPAGLVRRWRRFPSPMTGTEQGITTGLFAPNAPDAEASNCKGVQSLFFDADAADWAGTYYFTPEDDLLDPDAVKKYLHAASSSEIDAVLAAHRKWLLPRMRLLMRCEPTVLVMSGYGHHLHYWFPDEVVLPLEEARGLWAQCRAEWVSRNEEENILDRACKDQGTRLCRPDGTTNCKGKNPRPVEAIRRTTARLDLEALRQLSPVPHAGHTETAGGGGTQFKHVVLPPGTLLHSTKVEGIDLFTLPAKNRLKDFDASYRRVFCPFHEGTTDTPSAFLARYSGHWALTCGSCETVWHAGETLAGALALNGAFTFIRSQGKVWDAETGKLISIPSMALAGPAHRAWAGEGFDEFRKTVADTYWGPPERCPSNHLSLFNPAEVISPSTPGPCPVEFDRLVNNLTGGDVAQYEHLLRWLAYLLRFPWKRQVCLCLIGAPGTGKGMLFRVLAGLFGHYATTISPATLESQFLTGKIARRLLIAVEEADSSVWKDKAKVSRMLLTLTMDTTLSVNQKFMTETDEGNYAAWLFFSNSRVPVVLAKGDRRYAVIRSDSLLRDVMTNAERDHLGAMTHNRTWLQAVANYLGGVNLDGYDPYVPWDSAERQEALDASRSTAEVWWADNLPSPGRYPAQLLYAVAQAEMGKMSYQAWVTARPQAVSAPHMARVSAVPVGYRHIRNITTGKDTVRVIDIPSVGQPASTLRIPESLQVDSPSYQPGHQKVFN